MRDEYVTKAEFARRTGRSHQAVGKLVRSGKLPCEPYKGRMMVPYRRAMAALAENLDPAQDVNSAAMRAANAAGEDTGGKTYSELRLETMRLRLEQDELDYQRKLDSLIDVDDANRVIETWAKAACRSFAAFPDRYGADIAAELGVDPGKFHAALDKCVKAYLPVLEAFKFRL